MSGSLPRLTAIGLARRQLMRRPMRTGLTVAGIALAVAVLLSLFGFASGYRRALDKDIEQMGYEVLVTSKGCPYEAATLLLQGGTIPMYIQEDIYDRIVQDSMVKEISKLFLQSMPGDVKVGEPPLMLVMGIEEGFRALKPWVTLQDGAWFSALDADEAILGYNVATELEKSVGDVIEVGRHRRRPMKVVGIFDRLGAQDDGTIFLPLATAQYVFDQKDRLTGLGIKLRDLTDLDRFIRMVFDLPGVQVITMAQVRGTILSLVESARALVIAVSVVALVVAFMGVMNAILMSILERRRELGIMKAMGASGFDLFRFVWIESSLLCLAGALLGSVLALMLSSVVQSYATSYLQYAPRGSLVDIDGLLVLKVVVGTVAIGWLAGLYPASRAASIRPVETIRAAE